MPVFMPWPPAGLWIWAAYLHKSLCRRGFLWNETGQKSGLPPDCHRTRFVVGECRLKFVFLEGQQAAHLPTVLSVKLFVVVPA
ncbi:MAG TPA: hypothetical protein VKB42_20935, partial [Dongiaceae bacterium]|nr:hypothetical protein [Dongiaceae bacterium]